MAKKTSAEARKYINRAVTALREAQKHRMTDMDIFNVSQCERRLSAIAKKED